MFDMHDKEIQGIDLKTATGAARHHGLTQMLVTTVKMFDGAGIDAASIEAEANVLVEDERARYRRSADRKHGTMRAAAFKAFESGVRTMQKRIIDALNQSTI